MEAQVYQPISVEDFIEKYKPKMDEFQENFIAYCWTKPEELKAVQDAVKERRVWTMLDVDGEVVISAGCWRINRMDYLICDVPYEEGQEGNIDVKFD